MNSIIILVYVVLLAFIIAGGWKIFTKAGQPGWAVLVPIYNLIIMCKIAGKPAWWVVLMFVPVVNFIISIILSVGIAKNFGKGVGFAVGLIFLPFIFAPILAFGSAEYVGEPA